jgi:hypothetical protein
VQLIVADDAAHADDLSTRFDTRLVRRSAWRDVANHRRCVGDTKRECDRRKKNARDQIHHDTGADDHHPLPNRLGGERTRIQRYGFVIEFA